MFSGIVEEIGVVKGNQGGVLAVQAAKVLQGTQVGDSIAVDGACLTASRIQGNLLHFDVMSETLKRTNLGKLHYHDPVNLERALALGGRLGGHLVQGHVDEVGEVTVLRAERDALILEIRTTVHLMRYIVEKGFIAVDGVSLTATQCRGSSFSVSLVAYTQEHTTLGKKRSGDLVNLEADVIAKYVERLTRRESGVTWELLEKTGFATVGK